MDLRQFTTTPNNFDDQRRTSVSSTASGYASSQYGGVSNNTPSSARITQSRYFGQVGGPPPGFQGTNPSMGQGNWMQQGALNVAPWIEQQQEVSNGTTGLENQNFVNSYGQNLNANFQAGSGAVPVLNGNALASSQSIQATYDSRSTRASPSLSGGEKRIISNKTIDDTLSKDDLKQNDNDSTNINNDSNDALTNEQQNEDDSVDQDELELDDDELIPTAIVIKNIPFAIKKEQLLDVMTKLNLPLPYAFNYHFDNGVFRGLAFANFTSTDETTAVVTQLNGREIGGRKLRVEYKKMLPLAERERIEREKREKRGQLEEQHRSTSNASLASMISVASAPAGVAAAQAGVAQAVNTQAAGSGVHSSHHPMVKQTTGPQSERFYAPIPFVNNLPIQPQQIDFNDAETLEYYSQLLFFRDDRERLYNEIAYPASLTANHKRIISILTGWLGLIETNDGNLILIKRRSLLHDPSPLLRSQSHSTLPLLQSQLYNNGQQPQQPMQQPQQPQLTGGQVSSGAGPHIGLSQQQLPPQHQQQSSQRFRNPPQNMSLPQSPAQQHSTNPRIPPNFSLSGGQQALSSAAILRNNPTPTRINSNNFYQNQPTSATSQPGTPAFDSFSRFNLAPGTSTQPQQPLQPQPSGGLSQQHQSTSPFPQKSQLAHPQQGAWENSEAELNDGINSLNLGLDNGSNIWGPRA